MVYIYIYVYGFPKDRIEFLLFLFSFALLLFFFCSRENAFRIIFNVFGVQKKKKNETNRVVLSYAYVMRPQEMICAYEKR